MKKFNVTIQAKVIKTLEVEAPSQEEAEATAHELFHVGFDTNESYDQQTLRINSEE
jgi:hypothetical protein